MVRVIDSLVVYKDPDGELEFEHLMSAKDAKQHHAMETSAAAARS